MDTEHQFELLTQNAVDVVPAEQLRDLLDSGRPLRVKFGVDPTASFVTLGWAVVLRKLRQFQDLGHTAVLIVGDFTAQIGDPSDRSNTRSRLPAEETTDYAGAVLGGIRRILAPENLEVRYNSEWLGAMSMADLTELASKVTVAQMLERSDFRNRYEGGNPISLHEFLYPVFQGMDSVAVSADVELGGADQLWNLMMGRTLQESDGQSAQVALTMPLLLGTDGRKMSQSYDNFISIDDEPDDMFGKVMSVPDAHMESYFRLLTNTADVDDLVAGLAAGTLHPGEAKRSLAKAIVGSLAGEETAAEAERAFDRVFKEGGTPEDVPEHELGADSDLWLPGLMVEAGLAKSNGEARRLIGQGAVRLAGEKVTAEDLPRDALTGRVLQVGKRRFVRFIG